MLAKFIINLFGEVFRMKTFFYYYRSFIKTKQKITLSEKTVFKKSLGNTFNCIFLTNF